jgi:hypothetical protein
LKKESRKKSNIVWELNKSSPKRVMEKEKRRKNIFLEQERSNLRGSDARREKPKAVRNLQLERRERGRGRGRRHVDDV